VRILGNIIVGTQANRYLNTTEKQQPKKPPPSPQVQQSTLIPYGHASTTLKALHSPRQLSLQIPRPT